MKRFILGILIILLIGVIVAFATGFMTMDTEGDLRAPTVDINATGGELPKVDLDTKQVVVGTTEANVGAPGIGIEQRSVQVPVIGIRDGDEAGQNAAAAPGAPQNAQ